MIRRLFQRLLLRPEDLIASRHDLAIIGVFNPGAIAVGDQVVLLVRVAERPREQRPGFIALPRYHDGRLVVDWMRDEEVEPLDPRVVRCKADGLVRLTFVSHLRTVRCGDGRSVEAIDPPSFFPQTHLEEFGVEDPRITLLEDRYYFTYVSVSRHGPATALASTQDFAQFERHGVIFCPENKDVVLFPERIKDDFVALHRPNGATPFSRPEMWLARSGDLLNWGTHTPLLGGVGPWEDGRVGAGTPPVRVPGGWLEIYHGNRRPRSPGDVGVYAAGAFLLDAEQPQRVLRRAASPLLEPTADYECQGFVPGVIFPTGIVERDDTYLVYYGASDAYAAVIEVSRDEVLGTLA
jgi:predicted GH43/DUF377 family glycosyl hydrolase